MRRALCTIFMFGLVVFTAACGSDDGGSADTTTTSSTAPLTLPEETQPDRTEERTRLLLAPVLSSGPCPADTGATTGAAGRAYPTADGGFCYFVGEPGGDGNDLTDATLSEVNGEYLVYTRIKDDSVEKLDELFNACFAGLPQCPAGEGGNGYVAIIWEGEVLYAPAVQTEDLAADGLSLAGGLSEARARQLITLINR